MVAISVEPRDATVLHGGHDAAGVGTVAVAGGLAQLGHGPSLSGTNARAMQSFPGVHPLRNFGCAPLRPARWWAHRLPRRNSPKTEVSSHPCAMATALQAMGARRADAGEQAKSNASGAGAANVADADAGPGRAAGAEPCASEPGDPDPAPGGQAQ